VCKLNLYLKIFLKTENNITNVHHHKMGVRVFWLFFGHVFIFIFITLSPNENIIKTKWINSLNIPSLHGRELNAPFHWLVNQT